MAGNQGLHYAFRRLHQGENTVAEQLLQLSARHHAEHEVHHVARDLATWSARNLEAIAATASRYGLELADEPDRPGPLRHVAEALSTVTGRRPAAGLLLLEDLRELYLRAAETSLAWEMLAQHAQAKHEPDILALSAEGHPRTLRQLRWANTMIKTLSPQVLASL